LFLAVGGERVKMEKPIETIDLFTHISEQTQKQTDYHQAVISQMQNTAQLLTLLPESRFRSLAITRLEEASMWAHKAISFTMQKEESDG
jgi:hypothetical protein